MTDMPQNTSANGAGTGEPALPSVPADDVLHGSSGTSRRDAMAVLAKHATYTAPAVMAILTLSSKRAAAGYF